VKLSYEVVEIRNVWFRNVQQRDRVTKWMKFGWRKYPRVVLKRMKVCQVYKKECNIDDCCFIDARSLLFLKPEYNVGQKPVGTTGTVLIELYWHSAYIYWLSEKFKAYFFSTDNLPNSWRQAYIFCPIKLVYVLSVVKHGVSRDFCAILYIIYYICSVTYVYLCFSLFIHARNCKNY